MKDLPPPIILYILDVELMDVPNKDMESGSEERNINEGNFIDETLPFDPSLRRTMFR